MSQSTSLRIDDDPASYGSKGQSWNAAFVAYMRFIVRHPHYAGMQKFPELFHSRTLTPLSDGKVLDDWLDWIKTVLVPSEPSLLSPGEMSNAPDRFDGFHSFNRCCRGKADTGRHSANMKTYTTDRRVFVYWSEGNWIAADRMMGLVRARFASHPCADGGSGPPSPDHIGPLSLGFTHRPEFRLLSKSANSSKNNRMTLWDVEYLRRRESQGASVETWYATSIWQALRAPYPQPRRRAQIFLPFPKTKKRTHHLLLQTTGHFAYG